MIHLEALTKTFRHAGGRPVLDRVTLSLPPAPGGRPAGAQRGGQVDAASPDRGHDGAKFGPSAAGGQRFWPVGYAGSFHGDLTGAQNTRFIARLYGVDSGALADFARDFAEIGRAFDAPFRTYSAGMKARLAFGVSMGIGFDTYLVDEVTAVGDAAFRAKKRGALPGAHGGAGR